MQKEIAAVIGDDGCSTTLSKPGTVVVYRRNMGEWSPDRKIGFNPDAMENLAAMRKKMGDLISFLGECRIFVSDSATGARYFELMKAGCSVWEVSGRPDDFLEEVLEGEEKERAAREMKQGNEIPGPYEKSSGEFYISIREVQGKSPGLTSKQILQEFIRAGKFIKLEIICDHMPPWIEMESEEKGYEIKSERIGQNEVKVILINNNGN